MFDIFLIIYLFIFAERHQRGTWPSSNLYWDKPIILPADDEQFGSEMFRMICAVMEQSGF